MVGVREETLRRRESAKQDFYEVCKNFECVPNEILSRRRARPLPQERAMIAEALRIRGYSLKEIGHAMNRDHTSIAYLLKADMRMKKRVRGRNRYQPSKRTKYNDW